MKEYEDAKGDIDYLLYLDPENQEALELKEKILKELEEHRKFRAYTNRKTELNNHEIANIADIVRADNPVMNNTVAAFIMTVIYPKLHLSTMLHELVSYVFSNPVFQSSKIALVYLGCRCRASKLYNQIVPTPK